MKKVKYHYLPCEGAAKVTHEFAVDNNTHEIQIQNMIIKKITDAIHWSYEVEDMCDHDWIQGQHEDIQGVVQICTKCKMVDIF